MAETTTTGDARAESDGGERPPSRGKIFALALPTIFASLLMAAHFLRYMMTSPGLLPFFSLSLAMPFLFLVRRTWSVRVLQVWFVLGSVFWVGTINQIMNQRLLEGRPYVRMTVILSAVVVFTLYAALSLESKTLKRHWRSGWKFE